jgi:hypothetical protein
MILPVDIEKILSGRVSDIGDADLIKMAKDSLVGLRQRIKGADAVTEPAAYADQMVFHPEAQSFLLDTNQDSTGTNLVNYVVRSGVTYQIPIQIGGTGTFRAHAIKISFLQRLYVPTIPNGFVMNQAMLVPMPPMVSQFVPNGSVWWTTKFSLFPRQPGYMSAGLVQSTRQSPSVNFRWNIEQPRTGEKYCNGLLPMTAEGHRAYVDNPYLVNPDTNIAHTPIILADGYTHRFRRAWEFDAPERVLVDVRLLTDIIQFDSSIAGDAAAVGLPYDDRENGIRDQSVTIRAELLGERVS